jgi:hypothetical protein
LGVEVVLASLSISMLLDILKWMRLRYSRNRG